MDPNGLTTFLTNTGSVFTALTGHFGDVLEMFLNSEVLLVVFGIFITGAVIGLVTRLYRSA